MNNSIINYHLLSLPVKNEMIPKAKTKLRYEAQNGRAMDGMTDSMRDSMVLWRGVSLSRSHTAPPISLPMVLVIPPMEIKNAALPPSTPWL